MVCQGICHRYKLTKGTAEDSWYKQGGKRCTICMIFLKWGANSVHVVDICLETGQKAINAERI